jgi:hypothetical protein
MKFPSYRINPHTGTVLLYYSQYDCIVVAIGNNNPGATHIGQRFTYNAKFCEPFYGTITVTE